MTTVFIHRPTRALAKPFAAVALVGVLAALAACTTHDVNAVETTGAVPADYHTNHPIAVEEGVQTLDVPVAIYTSTLSDAFKANVVAFAQKFKESGSSLIAVVAPSGSPDQTVAAGIAVQVQNVLRQTGIPDAEVDYRVYHAASDERDAPVRVAYSAITAQTAPCGPYQDQLAVNRENTPYFEFGCATQQNLAAVVDNPLDLLYPRGLTPADAARRADVLAKYRTGTTFSSDLTRDLSNVQASQGVGQ
jgi:pilus assembly protein CpaD